MIRELERVGLTYRGLVTEWEHVNAIFGPDPEATDKLFLTQGGKKICIVTMKHDIQNNIFHLILKYDGKSETEVQGLQFADLQRNIQPVIDSYVMVKFGEQMSSWMALHSLLNIIEK